MNYQDNRIYCIGDSHVSFFSGLDEIQAAWPAPADNALPFFRVFRLGPVLAYSLSRYGSKSRGRENLFRVIKKIPLHSRILLCFGEIDCRHHILKQAEMHKRNLESAVAECVIRYISVATELTNMGYDIILWGVPPSSPDSVAQNPEFPLYGTCLERNRTAAIFNQFLADRCRSAHIKFISIFDELVDEHHETKIDYFMDEIHLSQKAMPLALARMQNIIPDMDFNPPHRLSIVTVSRIGSPVKSENAERSLRSLQNVNGDAFSHIVVDYCPSAIKRFLFHLPGLTHKNHASMFYAKAGANHIRKLYRGSLPALTRAVYEAYETGADLVLIHCENNRYAPVFNRLLTFAKDAFSQIPDLACVRIGGYPFDLADNPQAGGNSALVKRAGEVCFDAVRLQPDHRMQYTLWWSHFHEHLTQGAFLPLLMNVSIYRTGFLLRLLSAKDIRKLQHLDDVEKYFKNKDNWQKIVKTLTRKFGYINMQFGAAQMKATADESHLLRLPNKEIR